jgi:hypothetical protein
VINDEMNLAAVEIAARQGVGDFEPLALAVAALARTQHTANLLAALNGDSRWLRLTRPETQELAGRVRQALGLAALDEGE